MTRFFKIFFIVSLLLIVVAGIITWKWVFKEQDKTVGSSHSDFILPASELVKDFETDENKADDKYLNKIITVSGTIDSETINENEITVILKNRGETAGVSCNFDKTTVEKNMLKNGKTITVKGVCTGFLMDAVLTRCALIQRP